MGIHHTVLNCWRDEIVDICKCCLTCLGRLFHDACIVQVNHTAGYNYGLPRQRTSPRHDIVSPRSRNDRIRVCVRKRPRTAFELRQNDPDIVTTCPPGTIIVNELKSALDLSKYLQKVTWCTFIDFIHRFRFCYIMHIFNKLAYLLTSSLKNESTSNSAACALRAAINIRWHMKSGLLISFL